MVRRLAFVDQFIGLRDKRIIDLGCGRGDYVRGLLGYSRHVLGVEFDEAAVQQYRATAPRPDAVERGDIQQLRFEDHMFDVALANEVLEHVPDDHKALAEARRVLRPDGYLVVFSPNRMHPFETHGASTRRGRPVPLYVPGVPYLPLRFGSKVLRYHARNYWPAQLRQLIGGAGFDVVGQWFVWQTFENISGEMPRAVRAISPILRSISMFLEKTPGARRFGVSQLVIARPRPATPTATGEDAGQEPSPGAPAEHLAGSPFQTFT